MDLGKTLLLTQKFREGLALLCLVPHDGWYCCFEWKLENWVCLGRYWASNRLSKAKCTPWIMPKMALKRAASSGGLSVSHQRKRVKP